MASNTPVNETLQHLRDWGEQDLRRHLTYHRCVDVDGDGNCPVCEALCDEIDRRSGVDWQVLEDRALLPQPAQNEPPEKTEWSPPESLNVVEDVDQLAEQFGLRPTDLLQRMMRAALRSNLVVEGTVEVRDVHDLDRLIPGEPDPEQNPLKWKLYETLRSRGVVSLVIGWQP